MRNLVYTVFIGEIERLRKRDGEGREGEKRMRRRGEG